MEDQDLTQIIEKWREDKSDLETEQDEAEANQDPMLKAETESVRELVSYDLQIGVLEECIDELENCETQDSVLEAWGKWRDELEERDKRILDSREWFQNNYKRLQLESCLDDLDDFFATDLLTPCPYCESLKKPTHDKRKSENYRLDCSNC